MTEREEQLLAAIAAAPSDLASRQVYADHLIASGDERGELLSLDLAERCDRELSDLQPLLRLSAIHGFPRWPDDPDDTLLPFKPTRVPVQFVVRHGEIDHYVSYRRRVISVTTSVEWVDINSPALDLRHPDEWDAHETDVMLSIVSRTLRLDHDIKLIDWPCRAALADLERFTRKRRAHYHLDVGVMAPGRPARPDPQLGVIDYERWGQLWLRWDKARRGR